MPKPLQATMAALLAGTLLVTTARLAEADAATVAYPEGFRQWATVKSFVVGEANESFGGNPGFRHFYANEAALQGYRTGRFPDGAVIVDERLATEIVDDITRESRRLNINVMVKDSRRFAATDGWGFDTFKGEARASVAGDEARAACHACHTRRRAQDLVFSRFRD